MPVERFNGSGCRDSVAAEAIDNVDHERTEVEIRFHKLLKMVWMICDFAGFQMIGRLNVEDRATGRIFK